MRLTLLLILILYNGMLLDNPLLFSMLEVSLRGDEACRRLGVWGGGIATRSLLPLANYSYKLSAVRERCIMRSKCPA